MAIWAGVASAAAGSLFNSMSGSNMSPGQAQQMTDPFSQYRGMYGQQLNSLMQNPASVQTLPGYQASMAQGSNNLQRSMSASGQQQSGAEQIALSNYGQQFQTQAFQQQFNNLSSLSGAGANPANGGMAGVRTAMNNQNNNSALGGMFGPALGQGMQGLYNQGSGYLQGLFGGNSGSGTASPGAVSSYGPSAGGYNGGGMYGFGSGSSMSGGPFGFGG